MERQIYAVIYAVELKEMAERLCRAAPDYKKIFFTTFQELEEQKLDTQLKRAKGSCPLKEILEGEIESPDRLKRSEGINGKVLNA